LQKIAASEFLRLRLLLVLCEIELSFRLKNILIDIHVIECIFVCWAWKKYGIFEGNRTFFWYKSIEDFISYVIILCVLTYFIFLRWIAWYLIAFLFICLLVAIFLFCTLSIFYAISIFLRSYKNYLSSFDIYLGWLS